MPTHAIPTHYLRQLTSEVDALGGNGRQWLERNRVDLSKFDEATQIISFAAFRLLILDAIRHTRQPALGLRVGARLKLNAHGALGYVAMNSATLRHTAELLERYVHLRTQLIKVSIDFKGDDMRIVFHEPRPLDDIRRPILETVVLTVKNSLDQIAVEAAKSPVERVAFAYSAPDYASQYVKYLGCPVLFAQDWTGLVVPRSIAERPLTISDPTAFQEANKICQREVESLNQAESWSSRVLRLLEQDHQESVSLADVANLLHLSPRTLHRRLIAEGTSYNTLLEEWRHRRATEKLAQRNISIQEIAFSLGYTEMANFRRAFKRWEGIAPSEYRRKIFDR